MRVLVVGASSGIGRSIALGLAGRSDRVALLGRRHDRLAGAAREAGHGAVAVVCDVRDSRSCAAAIEEACTALGGADALVYSAGIGRLAPLVDTCAETWRDLLDTNVVGASCVTAAVLPALEAGGGRAVYLSSVSASVTPPWPGLGAYAVSKAALDKLVEAWSVEHPTVGFTRLVLGDTAGGTGHSATEFAAGWDPDLLGRYLEIWADRGYLSGALLTTEEIVDTVATLLDTDAEVPAITLLPRQENVPGRRSGR